MQTSQREARTLRITGTTHDQYPRRQNNARKKLSNLSSGQILGRFDFHLGEECLDKEARVAI